MCRLVPYNDPLTHLVRRTLELINGWPWAHTGTKTLPKHNLVEKVKKEGTTIKMIDRLGNVSLVSLVSYMLTKQVDYHLYHFIVYHVAISLCSKFLIN
jgi:hypothetical protein